MLKRILVAAFLALVPCAALAGPFEDGWAASQRGDYATALKYWRPLAEQGVVEAQHNLGEMYRKGEGVPQNDAKAVKWYRKAAEQGFASAQNSLGIMYNMGQGVPQDYTQAAKWRRKAAEQGHVTSQFALGLSCDLGEGVVQDYTEAGMPPLKWSTRWDHLIPFSGGPENGWEERETRRDCCEAAPG